MKIGLRGGHSPNCKGAFGINGRDEQALMRILCEYLDKELNTRGHEVIICNSNGYNANAELSEGASKANSNNVDLFVSLHMNAFNGSANGTEVLIAPGSSVKDKAQAILNNLCNFGFYNRGVKETSKLYEMRAIKAPNILIEVCFIDSQKDINIFSPLSWEDIATAIADGLVGTKKKEELNPNYYAVKPCDIVNGAGEKTGELWKDEKFELLWVDDTFRKYVRFWNYDYTKLKEGYISNGEVCKIGEEPPKEEIEEDVIYKVQLGSYAKKENAEAKLKELSEKGEEGFIVAIKKE